MMRKAVEQMPLSQLDLVLKNAKQGLPTPVSLVDKKAVNHSKRAQVITRTIAALTGKVGSLHDLRGHEEISDFRRSIMPTIKQEMQNRLEGVYALAPDVCSAPLPASMAHRLSQPTFVRFHYHNNFESKTMEWNLLMTPDQLIESVIFGTSFKLVQKFLPRDAKPYDYVLKVPCVGERQGRGEEKRGKGRGGEEGKGRKIKRGGKNEKRERRGKGAEVGGRRSEGTFSKKRCAALPSPVSPCGVYFFSLLFFSLSFPLFSFFPLLFFVL